MIPNRRCRRIGLSAGNGSRINHHVLERVCARKMTMLDIEHIVFQPPSGDRRKARRRERIRHTPRLHHASLERFTRQNRRDHEWSNDKRALLDRPRMLRRPGFPVDTRRLYDAHLRVIRNHVTPIEKGPPERARVEEDQNLDRFGVELSGTM